MASLTLLNDDLLTLEQLDGALRGFNRALATRGQGRDQRITTLRQFAPAVAFADDQGQVNRGRAAAELSPVLVERLEGRPVADIVADASLLELMRANWRAALGEPLTRQPSPNARAYDRFVAYEVALLAELGVPVTSAFRIVTRSFPARVGQVAAQPDAYRMAMTSAGSQRVMALRTFTFGPSPVSWFARLQALAEDDPFDPDWLQRVRRVFAKAWVQTALSIVESADGLAARDDATLVSIVLAGLRAAMEVGEEASNATDTAIYTVVGGVLGAVAGDGSPA